jgi:NAD/NADP transhydrogenase beta subunit
MSIILIIIGFILLVLGFLGLGVIRTIRWSKMPQWHAVVEMVLGIVVIIIGFMSL